jgi:hypothetical protein
MIETIPSTCSRLLLLLLISNLAHLPNLIIIIIVLLIVEVFVLDREHRILLRQSTNFEGLIIVLLYITEAFTLRNFVISSQVFIN